jgi:hypothetical protein
VVVISFSIFVPWCRRPTTERGPFYAGIAILFADDNMVDPSAPSCYFSNSLHSPGRLK